MKRAAVCNFHGDPFVISYWLSLYQRYWKNEVDTLYFVVSFDRNHIPKEVEEYDRDLLSKFSNIRVKYFNDHISPEKANELAIPDIEEGLVVLMEADSWVFRSQSVASGFYKIENEKYDMVSASLQLFSPSLEKLIGFQGFARWFLFCKTTDLLKTDLNFAPTDIKKGVYIPEFDYTIPNDISFETFGWMSFQLACLKPRIFWLPQNHLGPASDFNRSAYKEYGWFHIRQFSSSDLGAGLLGFKKWQEKDKEAVKKIKELIVPGENLEWIYTKIVALKILAWEAFPDKDKIREYSEEYKGALDFCIEELNLPKDRINALKYYYKELLEGRL